MFEQVRQMWFWFSRKRVAELRSMCSLMMTGGLVDILEGEFDEQHRKVACDELRERLRKAGIYYTRGEVGTVGQDDDMPLEERLAWWRAQKMKK